MTERKPPKNHRTEPGGWRLPEDIVKAFEREQATARDLSRRHDEITRNAHDRDRQVLIERRRIPR